MQWELFYLIFCNASLLAYLRKGVFMMKEIICISGDLYSGKSTVGEMLGKKLGYSYFSGGRIFRSIADSMGIDVNELNIVCDTNPDIDRLIDSRLVEIGKTENKIIVDSRMAWHFIKEGYKVRLVIDINEAARRALLDERRTTERYSSFDEALNGIKKRMTAEAERYRSKYGADILNPGNYDIVIDTTSRTPEEVTSILLEGYRVYLSKK